jgi:hypothetical protein
MRAADGEACSRMVQTMHPTADGAYYAVNYCGAMFGPSGGDPSYYYGLHDEYMSCVFEAGHDQCSSGSDSCEHANDGLCDDGGPGSDHGRIGTVDGKDRYCALGTDCTDCGPRPRAQGWPTGRAAQLGVCRPAVLPEKVGPSQIKSAALLEKELKTLGHAPCPGDARLVIAHLAPGPARDARSLTRAICACDQYVGASSVPPAGERMCAKDMLDPTAAGGRFEHLDHTPVMCYPTGANFPAVGKDDGGALVWHGCRSDQRPCTMRFTCSWTPVAPGSEGKAPRHQHVGRAPSAQACSAMVQDKEPTANGATYNVGLHGTKSYDNNINLKSKRYYNQVHLPGDCWALFPTEQLNAEAGLTKASTTGDLVDEDVKRYETCKFDGWQAPAAAGSGDTDSDS